MKKQINLLEGSILGSLTGLALPIMATSLVQMAYSLTDMAWVRIRIPGGSGCWNSRYVYLAFPRRFHAS